MKWERVTIDFGEKHQFSSDFVISANVKCTLTKVEIIGIYYEILKLVYEKGGIDKIQIFVDEKGRVLNFIDLAPGFDTDVCFLCYAHEV